MAALESGTIFKFNLPFDMGAAYAKVIDFGEVISYAHILVYVYDYFDDKEVTSADFFKDVPIYMNPLPIALPPTVRGKGAWKKIGILREEKDKIIPAFKDPVYEGFAFNSIEKYREVEWEARINLKDKIGPLHFDKVRHLEEIFLRSTTTIEKRVVMNILRHKGEDVEAFFNKNMKEGKAWFLDYKTMRYIPLYKDIPEPIRGKPLVKGYVPDEYLNWSWD
jgi:hypothetical protein